MSEATATANTYRVKLERFSFCGYRLPSGGVVLTPPHRTKRRDDGKHEDPVTGEVFKYPQIGDCTPIVGTEFDVDAVSPADAKERFNEVMGITHSDKTYTVTKISKGAPPSDPEPQGKKKRR